MTEESTISRARAIVESDVRACASYLVHTLAKAAHGAIASPDHRNPYLNDAISETMRLCDQAADLAAPILDYESAAIDAGWKQSRVEYRYGKPVSTGPRWWYRGRKPVLGDIDMRIPQADTAQEACEIDGIDPYEREVFEHWIVSRWLGEKLAAKGEKVDFDFAGLVIWARTTTGQAIYMDHVIQQIAKDLAND